MKKITAMLVLSASVFLSGCLGQNALFNKVQDWNATASNEEFVNQGISFVFWWLPVYGLTLLGDIIILNSVEFWSGTNPITGEPAKVKLEKATTQVIEDGLGNTATLTYLPDGSIEVLEQRNGQTYSYRLDRPADSEAVALVGDSPSLATR